MTHPKRVGEPGWFSGWPRVMDDGRGLTRNFCAAIRSAASPGAEWAVVAQDDVEPCPGFESGLSRVLGEAPDHADVVAFFSMGRIRDPHDVFVGRRWRARRRGELLWVMTVAFRGEVAGRAADGVERQIRPADVQGGRHLTTGCDERLSLWMDGAGVRAVTHLPNLVQHRGEVSIAGHGWTIGGRPRVSPTYTGQPMPIACGWLVPK